MLLALPRRPSVLVAAAILFCRDVTTTGWESELLSNIAGGGPVVVVAAVGCVVLG